MNLFFSVCIYNVKRIKDKQKCEAEKRKHPWPVTSDPWLQSLSSWLFRCASQTWRWQRRNSPFTTAAQFRSCRDDGRELPAAPASAHCCITAASLLHHDTNTRLFFCLGQFANVFFFLFCRFAVARCQGCVSSRWGCNWCIHEHVCTHKHTCSQGVTIYNQNVSPRGRFLSFACAQLRALCKLYIFQEWRTHLYSSSK